jgi:hypothetical protein
MRSIVALLVLLITAAAEAAPRVSLELATEKGFPITGAQQWSKALGELGISNFRIRSATASDRPSIESLGNEKTPSYRVVGILTADSLLVVPGGRFSIRDGGAIRNWLENLADQGAAGVTERRTAFGLLAKQLAEVQDDLKQPVDFSTRDMPISDALAKLERRLKIPLLIDPAAKNELNDVKLQDELTGISAGTAIAAMLRPAGLVMLPERPKGGNLQYRITKPLAGGEAWPIGWPPKKRPVEILPMLYEFINVEISDTPVQEAVDAIAADLKVPFLYDRNAMAWHEIDLTKINAKVPSKRSTYSLILQGVLRQAKMKPDLRLDEANNPFFWITSFKPIGK